MENVGFWQGLFMGIAAWFVFGTATFWLVLAALGAGLMWITEGKNDFFAVVLVIVAGWVILASNDLSLTANPLQWLKYAGIYLLIGAVWSFLKWISFLFSMRDRLRLLKEAFVANNNIQLTSEGKIPAHAFADFAEYLTSRGYNPSGERYVKITKPSDVIPTVSDRAGDLVRWIVWWPTSAVWTILNDPVRRVATLIVRTFRGVYTKTAKAVFGDTI